MKLTPQTAPGRANRRARAYSGEIARLRNEGYGYGAIRQALAEAGVAVSISTVRREIIRLLEPPPCVVPVPVPTHFRQQRTVHTGESRAPPARTVETGPRTGRDVAEAFMKGQITNPLFRSKEPR